MPENTTGIPQKIGHYTIERVLGEGGMSTVYLGHDDAHPAVAIKVLKPEFVDGQIATRLMAEGKVIARLNHLAIVKVYTATRHATHGFFIAMEYLDGGELGQQGGRHSFAQLSRPHSQRRCIGILKPIAEAIDLAHDHGIVHCDIKPGNILFGKDDKGNHTPRLTDFGIANWSPSEHGAGAAMLDYSGDATRAHQASEPGSRPRAGTPAYTAPEVLNGGAPTALSDNYSLAVVAYEMLTGCRPFPVTAFPEEGRTLSPEEFRLPGPIEGQGDFHTKFGEIFRKALNFDSRQRYPKAVEFVEELRKTIDEELEARPVTLKELPQLLMEGDEYLPNPVTAAVCRRRRGQRKLALAFLSVAFLLGFTLWAVGGLHNLPAWATSGPIGQTWTDGDPFLVSARLLAHWATVPIVFIGLFIYALCLLFTPVARRAGTDRFWHKQRRAALSEKLTGRGDNLVKKCEKLGYQQGELWQQAHALSQLPESKKRAVQKKSKQIASDLIEACDRDGKLWALGQEVGVPDKENHMSEDPARRAIHQLHDLMTLSLLVILGLSLLLLPALAYNPPQLRSPLRLWAAWGVVLLGPLSLVGLHLIFSERAAAWLGRIARRRDK